jgi:hypothetical protein
LRAGWDVQIRPAGAAGAVFHRARTVVGGQDGGVPFAPYPLPAPDPALDRVADALDPVLTPLGFAPGQAGASEGQGQVIFCRGDIDSSDGGCVDLVIDLEATPDWRISDVRYWGYPSDRWHLAFDAGGDLGAQLAGLARTLPRELA